MGRLKYDRTATIIRDSFVLFGDHEILGQNLFFLSKIPIFDPNLEDYKPREPNRFLSLMRKRELVAAGKNVIFVHILC